MNHIRRLWSIFSVKRNMVTRVFLTPTKSYWTCFAIPTAANIMNMSNATTAVEMMVRAGHGASDQVRSCMKHIVTHQKENGAIMPGAAHHPNTHTFGKSRPVRNSTSSTRTFQPVKWNYIFFLLWNFTGWLRFVYFLFLNYNNFMYQPQDVM